MSGLKALKKLAQERRISEICISPQIDRNNGRQVEQVCADLGFRAKASAVPNMTLILNVTCDLDKIIGRFHKSTRYEVVRAGRLGITVRRAENEADFMHFFNIYSERAAEKGFGALSIADFTALSERIRKNPERSALFLSEYRGDLLAGAVVMRAGPRVHYIYGATGGKAGNLPGLYPIFRRAIEWAKEIGCTEFDFGGYGPSGSSSVRRFKEGFGGEVRNFGPAYSLTLMPLVPGLRRAVGLFRS
jgi:lipid II:glycine glycyltransferase (peptidoglycan interpeptide bridge formation enzyme)